MSDSKELTYRTLSAELTERIREDREAGVKNKYRCSPSAAVRRRNDQKDTASIWRPAFVRDCEKIMHLPFYNRYTDKTQVFSFYHNDDITRRALHVQLVSRIGRNIGAVLGLDLDLIEAIALGHDIGHTPFGHAGERFLSELLMTETGRAFNHNVQSVRVLDRIFVRNITMQTLDGILCHNGEFELQEYRPRYEKTFSDLDSEIEACYTDAERAIKSLVPCTLEACVVRICDMIAYLGKDRQDARIAHIIGADQRFSEGNIGAENAQIINNLTVDIIENSYGKDHLLMSEETYNSLKQAKRENYEIIYKNKSINDQYNDIIRPMFGDMYYKLLDDLREKRTDSLIYTHHIAEVEANTRHYSRESEYIADDPNMIVADYIASMTDDYFLALYEHLFPNKRHGIEYKSYFEA